MDLRRLIVALTLCSALIPLANTFYASYSVQREQLMQATLRANQAYARKLAKSTEDFLQSTLQQLAYTATLLPEYMDNPARLDEEAARLRLQTKSFNSVTILDAHGVALATSPETLQLRGHLLRSAGVSETLQVQAPHISAPYLSTAGNYSIFISHPIMGAAGEFIGVVGGNIYLKQENILNFMLGTHFYQDGSYLFVVDDSKRIIYHPDPARVGDTITGNIAIDEVTQGLAGSSTIVNSKGLQMLAGYAAVPSTGWGVVAQRPLHTTLAPLTQLMRNVLAMSLPLAIITLALAWWGARRIARPLQQLASGARTMDQPGTAHTIQGVKSWYFEAQELKKAMLLGLDLLHQSITKLRHDVHTDPLSGLGNRRDLNAALATLQAQDTPFAVVSVDIDHFKRVNDTYGHDVGDRVIQQLAEQMRAVCRSGDVPCRVGGEEFVMVLPYTSLKQAAGVAERLRQQVASSAVPQVGHITISLGVAHWPDSSADVGHVFKHADTMLYAAKHQGRNRVVSSVNTAPAPTEAVHTADTETTA